MKSLKLILILVVCVALTSALQAQGTSKDTGNMRGLISDMEEVPLPGATVTVTGAGIMGSRNAVTDAQGLFRFPLLPVGSCDITVELEGFQTVKREAIIISLGHTVTINIQMPQAALQEMITVTAASPIVDVKASKVTTTFRREMIQNLPIGRSLNSVVALTPGVVSTRNIKGGTAANTIYQVDGLNAQDPDNAQLGVNIDFNTMEEIEITTGGSPAEVGITSGALINVVTRSGGNDFSGHFQVYYDDESFSTVVLPESQIYAYGLGKPAVAVFQWDGSGSVGGPIIRDKLWFYVNGRYGKNERRSGFKQWTDPRGVTYDEYNRKEHNWGGFAKLSFQMSRNFRLAVHVNARENFRNTRASGLFVPFDCQYHDDPWGNYSGTGVFTWLINQDTYMELRGGWVNVDAMLTLVRPELETVPYMYDSYGGYYFGTGYRPNEWVGRPSYQGSLHLSRFQDDWLGADHELKAGIEIIQGDATWASWKVDPIYWRWYNSPWAQANNAAPYYYRALYELDGPHPSYGDGYVAWRVYGQQRETSGMEGSTWRTSFYAQDSLTIKNRLTINAGVRWDRITGSIPEVVKDRSGGIAYEIGEAYIKPTYGINPYDAFTQPGADNLLEWTTITPRVGITYDLFGDGKTALKLNIGRYSDWVPVSMFAYIHPLRPKTFYFRWWDSNNNQYPDAPGSGGDYYEHQGWYSPLIMLRENWIQRVKKPMKTPYDDQIMVGLDHELLRNFKVGVSYLYKQKKNIFDDAPMDVNTGQIWYKPDSGYWVPFSTTVPGIDEFEDAKVDFWFKSADAPEVVYTLTNIEDAFRKYSGLEISFEKRMANGWQLGGSINYSKTWGNTEGDYGDIFGYAEQGDDANWYVFNEGRLPDDTPLVMKLFGTFDLPFGFLGSFYYQYYDGRTWERRVSIYPPYDWAVANNVDPYWTASVRTEDRGSRRYYTRQNLDIRLEKLFNFGRFGRFGAYVDVFNALGNHYVNINESPGGTWYPEDNNTTEGRYVPSGSYKRITSITGLSRTFRFSVRFMF
jgi:hypothetical protein